MKPDRIFLAEVRRRMLLFVRLAASGHPGSITSGHAGSFPRAFEQMALMIREGGAGGGLRMSEIKWLLGVVVDVIVQFDRDERGRFISELYYEPRRQRLARWNDAEAAMSSTLPMSSWPVGRKAAAGVFATLCLTVLSCAAVYGAGVLFLLLNKANPLQASFASIVHYWDLYSGDPPLRKKLLGSIAASGFGFLILLPGTLVAAARRRRPLHGDARFANLAEVARAGLLADQTQPARPAILVGRYRGRFLSLPGQLSVMLSAPTRSGKGVGVVIPNLLN
jgi:hypothetical protein